MPIDDIPDIGLGTYRADPDECERAVETALELGYRHLDTAEMYENESAVGRGIDAATVDREDVFLATKVSPGNLASDDVIDHAEASLERLGVESVDLFYVHWPLRSYDPEETLAAFDELHDRGLIGHVGLSNFTPALLTEAIDRLDAPLFAHQVECHPLFPQDELRRLAREEGHDLVAYAPIARGRVFDVPEIVEVAEENDATPAQVSLAWLLSKESVVVIPKSTTEAHIRENFAAGDLTLDDDDLARIDAIDRTERVVDFDGAPWN